MAGHYESVRFTLAVGQYHGTDGYRYMVRARPGEVPWYYAVRLTRVSDDPPAESVPMGEGETPIKALEDLVVRLTMWSS